MREGRRGLERREDMREERTCEMIGHERGEDIREERSGEDMREERRGHER